MTRVWLWLLLEGGTLTSKRVDCVDQVVPSLTSHVLFSGGVWVCVVVEIWWVWWRVAGTLLGYEGTTTCMWL